MAARHDGLYSAYAGGTDDNALTRAQAALTEALTELSRLTQDPLFVRVDDVVANLVNGSARARIDLDTVHKLRDLSAGYQRVAIELEAAAACCRLVEREISKRVDAQLAGWDEELSAARGHPLEPPPAIERRRAGRDGWLSEIFRRGRADARHSAEGQEPVTPEQRPPAPVPAVPPAVLLSVPPAVPPGPPAAPDPPTAPTAQADVAAHALGPLEVRVGGNLVPRWNSLKARAVFQYLLVHQDRPTRRDVLMALQWPDHSHNSARNNLNVALYSLRNTLGPGQVAQPILHRDGCYMLNPELDWWIDRNEFLSALDHARLARQAGRLENVVNSYHKAISLYRGPLFEDDCAGEWYLPEQRRLKDLYGQALERVAEIHFQLGELPEALQFCQLGLSHDQCSEAVHRLLMRCYASRRQQQLVSRQYQACSAALREELGVSPSDETTRLLHELI
jgi:SARP family transcriptional regulator, regulator of embCAB operon